MITLRPDASTPLISQIVEGIRALIETQSLKPGARLPSIRAFAASHGVSVFTVVEAYNRMVAQGLLVSYAHQGFFVARRTLPDELAPMQETRSSATPTAAFDEAWFLQHIFENRDLPIKPGCGWLPDDWLFEDAVRRSFRQVAAESVPLGGYGDPLGYMPLRRQIAESLAFKQQIMVQPDQVLLGHGSSQALDWAVRTLVQPGQTVLVDDPGYSNLNSILHFQGARLLGVPRTPAGYDMQALEQLMQEHSPRVFFTQPRMQSPTGSRASLAQLHRLLTLAAQHDVLLVENDLYADLAHEGQPSLASLDGLQRVVYVGSFSKTISPNLRVGFTLAAADMVARLAHLKMLSGLTSSEIAEKLVYRVVINGRWRKHLKSLRDRLQDAHGHTSLRLQAQGFELFSNWGEGLFIWARHPTIPDSAHLARQAVQQGILFGPGQFFRVDAQPTGWMRFNVAYSQDEAVWRFLDDYVKRSRQCSP